MSDITNTGLLTRGQAIKELMGKYLTIYREPITKERAVRILEIAQEFGRRAEPCAGGFVHVVAREHSMEWPYTERFQIYNHANPSPGRVARARPARYTSGRPQTTANTMKETLMPARTRRAPAKAAPEPESVEDEAPAFDPDAYLNKPLTATMEDYVEWWRNEVGDPDEIASELLITLGARFYNIFQKSDFNITRREERRTERASTRAAKAAANGSDEDDEEDEATPPRKGRAAAAKPAGRTRAAAAPAEAAPARRPAAKAGGRRPKAGAAAY